MAHQSFLWVYENGKTGKILNVFNRIPYIRPDEPPIDLVQNKDLLQEKCGIELDERGRLILDLARVDVVAHAPQVSKDDGDPNPAWMQDLIGDAVQSRRNLKPAAPHDDDDEGWNEALAAIDEDASPGEGKVLDTVVSGILG